MFKKILSSVLLLLAVSNNPLYATSTSLCNDTDTSIMLHMEGANLGTTFTDSSVNTLTVTPNGGAVTSTVAAKFGSSAGLFVAATTSYLSVADNAVLDLGTGDFTVDFWLQYVSTTGNQVPFDLQDGYNTGVVLNKSGGGNYELILDGVEEVNVASGVSTATWYHITVMRSGTTVYLFKDGVSLGSGTSSVNLDSTQGLKIGLREALDLKSDAYIDEFRVVKGTAVFSTGGFTPPTAAYADSCSNARRKVITVN